MQSDELNHIAEQVRACTRCVLYKQAINAEIMMIGEGPGAKEDQLGRPFVGPAGKVLDEMLASINLKRADIFITNVVKHRPPNNRDPLPEEMEACRVWLDQQIALIQPKVIITISRFAMARWFPNEKISAIHGRARRFDNLLVVPMFHPAAVLHNVNLRPLLEADFKKLPQYLRDNSRPPPPAPPQKDEPPQQLKMF